MTPEELLRKMQAVPYKRNGSDFKGMDCWGWIETWFREIYGVEITDRKGQQSAPEGFQEGFEAKTVWTQGEVADGAVWTAPGLIGSRDFIQHGHCGIVYQGIAYHMHEKGGFCSAPITDRQLRINGFWIHECNR